MTICIYLCSSAVNVIIPSHLLKFYKILALIAGILSTSSIVRLATVSIRQSSVKCFPAPLGR